MGTQYARLQIGEISEICGITEEHIIVDIVQEMIEKKQIHAKYFESSRAIAFNQQI